MAHFPEGLDTVETRIINKIITAALDADLAIRVRDYEEGEIHTAWTRNRADIQRATAISDGTIYDLSKEGTRQGSVVLIHGNGEDVFADLRAPDNDKLDILEALFDGVSD